VCRHLEEWASPHSPCPAVSIDIVRVCVMCVTVLELPGRKRWSNWWHLHALWSRFLSHSPVHETQHVHVSQMLMIRWCFAGKYSPISGLTACVDCRAGKFQTYAGRNDQRPCTYIAACQCSPVCHGRKNVPEICGAES
jgi:hypothetical protein